MAEHSFTKCEAVKTAYRQTKEGMVISFAIHPSDLPPELALAPVGTRVLLAVAEIGDDETVAEAIPAAPVKSPDPDKSQRGKDAYAGKPEMEKAVVRAVLLCRDEAFQAYVGAGTEDATRAELCKWLGVESRREIASKEHAFRTFLNVEHGFAVFQGREPEPR
jgi:hypothetical protein